MRVLGKQPQLGTVVSSLQALEPRNNLLTSDHSWEEAHSPSQDWTKSPSHQWAHTFTTSDLGKGIFSQRGFTLTWDMAWWYWRAAAFP